MTRYSYKVIPAPSRGVKAPGIKGAGARFAHGLEQAINDLAAEGWEYLRADILPSEERQGLTSTATVYRSVLVFRRALQAAAAAPVPAPVAPATVAPAPAAPDLTDDAAAPREPAFRRSPPLTAPPPEPSRAAETADDDATGTTPDEVPGAANVTTPPTPETPAPEHEEEVGDGAGEDAKDGDDQNADEGMDAPRG